MKHVHKEWTSELAAKTEQILRRAQEGKSFFVRSIDNALYWVLLILSIIGNFVISVVLVPFFLITKGAELYVALFLIGLSFGGVFSFILHNIERLDRGHHIIAGIFIPALALINVAIMALLSNHLITLMNLPTGLHNPLLVGVMYVGGYVLPDIVIRVRK